MSEGALRLAYKRSISKGLISQHGKMPTLTDAGRRHLAPFQAPHLAGAQLMVIFDIPEDVAWKRQKFRAYLREFQFQQIQKSVWVTSIECRTYIQDAVDTLDLATNVQIFEARAL